MTKLTQGSAVVQGWLAMLSDLAPPPASKPLDADRLALLADMLVQDHPVDAFNRDSLRWVAQGQAWFPAYDTIRTSLAEWIKANPPRRHAIAGPGQDFEPTPAEQCHLEWFDKRMGQIGQMDDRRAQDEAVAHLRDWSRKYFPRMSKRLWNYRGPDPVDRGPIGPETQAVLDRMKARFPSWEGTRS